MEETNADPPPKSSKEPGTPSTQGPAPSSDMIKDQDVTLAPTAQFSPDKVKEYTGLASSPIGSLPPEVRNMIYKYALSRQKRIQLVRVPKKYEKDGQGRRIKQPFSFRLVRRGRQAGHSEYEHKHATALLQTCRQIREEATLLFYDINGFELNKTAVMKRMSEVLDGFQNQIGAASMKVIKDFQVNIAINDALVLDSCIVDLLLHMERGNISDCCVRLEYLTGWVIGFCTFTIGLTPEACEKSYRAARSAVQQVVKNAKQQGNRTLAPYCVKWVSALKSVVNQVRGKTQEPVGGSQSNIAVNTASG